MRLNSRSCRALTVDRKTSSILSPPRTEPLCVYSEPLCLIAMKKTLIVLTAIIVSCTNSTDLEPRHDLLLLDKMDDQLTYQAVMNPARFLEFRDIIFEERHQLEIFNSDEKPSTNAAENLLKLYSNDRQKLINRLKVDDEQFINETDSILKRLSPNDSKDKITSDLAYLSSLFHLTIQTELTKNAIFADSCVFYQRKVIINGQAYIQILPDWRSKTQYSAFKLNNDSMVFCQPDSFLVPVERLKDSATIYMNVSTVNSSKSVRKKIKSY